MHLVAMEISKKQNYIFKSNKLKENIGASLIIKYVTEDLPYKYLEACHGEPIFEGGGGSFFKFDKKENAENFIKELSLEIMKEYEGIEFYAIIEDMKTAEISANSFKNVKSKLEEKKNKRLNLSKKISFGVDEICRSSNSPSIIMVKDDKTENKLRAVSKETAKKLKWGESKDNKPDEKNTELKIIEQLEKDLGKEKSEELKNKLEFREYLSEDKFKFPYDLDKFGEKNLNSNLAIICIDGNKMGNMIDELGKEKEDFTEELKKFSNYIKYKYEEAFRKVVEFIENNEKSIKFTDNYIPIRPLILAGDDICYICDSRIAIETAKIFLEQIEKMDLEDVRGSINDFEKLRNRNLSACAGIAFVNKKSPFSQGYELAEELCKNAKEKIKKIEDNINKENQSDKLELDISLIDWHIAKGEISESIKEIRKKMNLKFESEKNEKQKNEKLLHIKPIFLRKYNINLDEEFIYNDVKRIANKFIEKTNDIRVGKLRELMMVIPQGKDYSDLFVEKYRLNFEKLNGIMGLKNYAYMFKNGKYLYYDILEIADETKFFLNCRGEKDDQI